MAWQERTQSGRIVSMAYAAENTAAPSVPALGVAIDWTAQAGWTVAADRDTSTAFRFHEDDFEFNDSESKDGIVVKPPLSIQKDALIIDQPTVLDNIVLTSYEAGSKVLTMATNWTETTDNVWEKGLHTTRRALCIEVEGLGLHYMPSVEIDAGTAGGGIKKLATQQVTIQVFRGSAVESGYQWLECAAA